MSNTQLFIPELGDKFIDYRQEIWGNSFTWSWERPMSQAIWLVIHHTVTTHDATPDQIAYLHKARGWSGIGYHLLVDKAGRVWYVGDIGVARAHIAGKNEKGIGISLIGDFTKHLPSDEQIVSTHKLCKFLIGSSILPNVKSWDDVLGHKDVDPANHPTACPGSSWDKSTDGDMWWRVKTGTPYTPQQPPTQQEDLWDVVYKGETIASYEYNPEDKLQECNRELQIQKETNGALVLENAALTAKLTQQEKDNAALLTEKSNAIKARDAAKAIAITYQRQIKSLEDQIETLETNKNKEIQTLKDEIVVFEQDIINLKSGNPLKAYKGRSGGWALVKIGLKQVIKGGE